MIGTTAVKGNWLGGLPGFPSKTEKAKGCQLKVEMEWFDYNVTENMDFRQEYRDKNRFLTVFFLFLPK